LLNHDSGDTTFRLPLPRTSGLRVELTSYGGNLKITNVGDETIAIRDITINDRPECTNLSIDRFGPINASWSDEQQEAQNRKNPEKLKTLTNQKIYKFWFHEKELSGKIWDSTDLAGLVNGRGQEFSFEDRRCINLGRLSMQYRKSNRRYRPRKCNISVRQPNPD
jgi:hypothetical protein